MIKAEAIALNVSKAGASRQLAQPFVQGGYPGLAPMSALEWWVISRYWTHPVETRWLEDFVSLAETAVFRVRLSFAMSLYLPSRERLAAYAKAAAQALWDFLRQSAGITA